MQFNRRNLDKVDQRVITVIMLRQTLQNRSEFVSRREFIYYSAVYLSFVLKIFGF